MFQINNFFTIIKNKKIYLDKNFYSLNAQRKLVKKKFGFIIILASLLIPSLITGPFIPDLILSCLVMWFIYYVLSNKEYKYFKIYPIFFFFLFCIVILFSSLISENILLSFESSLFYFRIGVFAILIVFLIDKNKNIFRYFYFFFILSFSILVLDGFIQFFNGTNLLGFEYKPPRVASLFGDETVLDSYLCRLFPLFFALFVIKKQKSIYEIIYVSTLFILTDVLIFLGGGRASFFYFNLSTIFIIVFITKFKILRISTYVISILIIIFLSLNNYKLIDRMVKNTVQQMGLESKSQKIYIFTKEHDSHYRTAYKIFLDNPIIGIGPKLFRIKCSENKYSVGSYPCTTHPHNFYIQLLSETGILGFLFLFLLLLYVLREIWLQLKSKIYLNQKPHLTDYQVCLLAGILISVWPLSPNGNFFNNWLMIVYSLPFGFFLHTIFGQKRKKICF